MRIHKTVLMTASTLVLLLAAACAAASVPNPSTQVAPTGSATADALAKPIAAQPNTAGSGRLAAINAEPSGTPGAAEVGATTLPLGSYTNPLAHGGPGILTLSAGGQYEAIVSETDRTPVKGTWKVTSDQIEFTETEGACPGIQGTYKWASDGKVLRFWLVQDTCAPRAGDLVSGPWTKQP
jgi:hypothetical protein